MIIAETKRLILRHLVPADAEALHPVFCDAEGNRFTLRTHRKLAETADWITAVQTAYAKRGFGPWCIALKSDDKAIGYCGCGIISLAGAREYEIGYRVVRFCWGQGFATEAVRATLEHALGKLNFRRIVAVIQPGNAASIRVAQKAGMEYEKDSMYEGVMMKVYVAYAPGVPRPPV